jgi:hypothetical protein
MMNSFILNKVFEPSSKRTLVVRTIYLHGLAILVLYKVREVLKRLYNPILPS